MKKYYNYAVLIIRCLWFLVKFKTPYGKALIHIAYTKYQQTPMYRERLVALDIDFAFQCFINNRQERQFFFNKITKKEKIKAFFLPYNYISADTIL